MCKTPKISLFPRKIPSSVNSSKTINVENNFNPRQWSNMPKDSQFKQSTNLRQQSSNPPNKERSHYFRNQSNQSLKNSSFVQNFLYSNRNNYATGYNYGQNGRREESKMMFLNGLQNKDSIIQIYNQKEPAIHNTNSNASYLRNKNFHTNNSFVRTNTAKNARSVHHSSSNANEYSRMYQQAPKVEINHNKKKLTRLLKDKTKLSIESPFNPVANNYLYQNTHKPSHVHPSKKVPISRKRTTKKFRPAQTHSRHKSDVSQIFDQKTNKAPFLHLFQKVGSSKTVASSNVRSFHKHHNTSINQKTSGSFLGVNRRDKENGSSHFYPLKFNKNQFSMNLARGKSILKNRPGNISLLRNY